MKILSFVLIILFGQNILFAQNDTVFMDKYFNPTDKSDANTFWVVNNKNNYQEIKEYDLSGKLVLQNDFYKEANEMNLTIYDELGKRQIIKGKIKNESLVGIWFYYTKDGIKQLDYTKTVPVDTTLNYDDIIGQIKIVDDMPTFQGGNKSLFYYYLKKEFIYPYLPERFGIKGKFFIQFIINKKGEIVNLKIEKSLHPHIDKEIERIIVNSPNWRPAKINGKRIDLPMTIPFEIF